MASRGRFRFELTSGIVLVAIAMAYLAFAGPRGIPTTNLDKALVHRNLLESPYVPRLTLAATRSNYGKDIFADIGACLQVCYQEYSHAPIQQVSITLDPGWRRIIHTQDFALVRDWGDDDPDPLKNLRVPIAMVANSDWYLYHNDVIHLYIADVGRRCVLRAWYDFSAKEMGFGDSVSFTSDSLDVVQDLDVNDNGSPGDWYDDTLWVYDWNYRGPRLVLYCPWDFASGLKGVIPLSVGEGPGQVRNPLRIAMGRDLTGANTKELYMIDRAAKIVQYRISSGALVYENEYRFGWVGAQRQEIVEPVDLTVDSYGQVYVSTRIPSSRIYKFTPDLQLLYVFEHEGKGDDDIWNPGSLYNSPRTVDYAGFDNLLVSEDWSTETGGQRYAIGVKDSLVSALSTPHYFDLAYLATDPHALTLKIEKWTGSAWSAFDTVSYGFKFSGTTEASWELPAGEWGYDHQYRLRFITKSTYSPVPGSGGVTFADTMTYQVTMGNVKPRIVVPLAVSGLRGGCILEGFTHTGSISAQDDDTPGSLTYTWRDLNTQAQFYNPSTHVWVSMLSGPWNSVELKVPGAEVAAAELFPPVNLSVSVADAGGGSVGMDRTYGVCSESGTCSCPSTCDCPSQGDVNGDFAVDVFDIVRMIVIAFSGAPPAPQDPLCPRDRADVNNDGGDDVFDVIYLIGYAFSGGPSPVNPCGP